MEANKINKPIGKVVRVKEKGIAEVELNDYGLKKFIFDNIKEGELVDEEELIRRINKKLEKNL